jgi:hypothetical protein
VASQALVMTRCTLSNNSATAAGGGVAAFWSLSALISNCSFANNSISAFAPAGGAMMALDVAALSVHNCSFDGNWVLKTAELPDDAVLGYITSVVAPGSGSGGALWIGADGAAAVEVLGSTFAHNWATSAGAVHVTGNVTFVLRWSNFEHDHAYGDASGGGALVTDLGAVSQVSDSRFYSCEAVRGGGGWHGGASQTTYTDCIFEENEAAAGDGNTKGTALFVGDHAALVVTRSKFLRNQGFGLAAGTVALTGSNRSTLHVEDSLFDSNFARLGACLMIVRPRACVLCVCAVLPNTVACLRGPPHHARPPQSVPSQTAQLSLSAVNFTNNTAYVASIMFTESVEYEHFLNCAPVACDVAASNTAVDYGQDIATSPKTINLTMPRSVRSGAPLPISISLLDGCAAARVRAVFSSPLTHAVFISLAARTCCALLAACMA